MPRIFISYRRAESGGWVTAIYKELIKHFDPADIFRDIDTLDFGVDFVQEIENAVQQCDVLLAMIGPQWEAIMDKKGRRRLDDPNDFVRLEIVTALKRDIRVIPVLVGDAAMPYEEQLPGDLQPLCRRNALEIGDRDFDHHMERLVRALSLTPTAPEKPVVPQVEDILPSPFEWILIPSGEIVVDKISQYVFEFNLAKYPITNQQYQIFVDAEDGYCDPVWWAMTYASQRWRKAHQIPTATAFAGDDLPRTNVCWYDAVAFCRWLSHRIEQKITLPTESEWQRAAQSRDRRKYPWGDRFDRYCCNFNTDGPTPVTSYPSGASPFGVMDMSGNVWEWCWLEAEREILRSYSENVNINVYRTFGHTDIKACMLRGGSWLNSNSESLTVVSRSKYAPDSELNFAGFRIALHP